MNCRLPLVVKNQDGSYTVASNERRIKMVPVGWDALVVITNQANREITAIGREQLQKVLTGEITRWSELGASSDKPINLYVRKGTISGVGLTLRQQLFNNRDQPFSPRATVLGSSGKIETAVEKDPYGIAVSGISSSRHRDLNLLRLDGIEPSMASLKSGKYSLFRILFLVAPNDYAEREELKGFVDFAHSPRGQQIMEQAGTLPYHRGVHLLFTAASYEYLHSIDVVEQLSIYTLAEN